MSFHIHICLYVILCHHIHKMIIRSANTRNEPLWVCICDTTVHAIEEVVVLSVRLKFNSWISLTRFFPTLKPFSFPQTDFVSFFFFFGWVHNSAGRLSEHGISTHHPPDHRAFLPYVNQSNPSQKRAKHLSVFIFLQTAKLPNGPSKFLSPIFPTNRNSVSNKNRIDFEIKAAQDLNRKLNEILRGKLNIAPPGTPGRTIRFCLGRKMSSDTDFEK